MLSAKQRASSDNREATDANTKDKLEDTRKDETKVEPTSTNTRKEETKKESGQLRLALVLAIGVTVLIAADASTLISLIQAALTVEATATIIVGLACCSTGGKKNTS